MSYIFCAFWQTSLRFRFFVHSGADFRFFVRISCVNSDRFSNPCEISFFRAWSDLKPICVFVLSCGKRFIPISNSLFQFQFQFQLRFPFPFHFPLPVPLPPSSPVPVPLRLRLRRPTLSRRSVSLSFAAALMILPTIRRSRIVHTAPALMPPARARPTQNGIIRNQILFLRTTQKNAKNGEIMRKCKKIRKCAWGVYAPGKN